MEKLWSDSLLEIVFVYCTKHNDKFFVFTIYTSVNFELPMLEGEF